MKSLSLAIIFSCTMFVSNNNCSAQTSTGIPDLPVNITNAVPDSSKPFVFYITGDGGWNKFSKNLASAFAAKGYPVVSLNAEKYFWDKKTPQQAAADVSKLLLFYRQLWKKKNVVLIGYSFGADVMPFIYNQLPAELANQVVNINLLSPSAKTDFEIHLMVMLGGHGDGEPVAAAINKITSKPIILLFGENEDDFPLDDLTIKNYTRISIPGGHHYGDDELNVCNSILLHLPKR